MKMSAVKNFTFFSLHALFKYKFSYFMSSSIVPLISYFFISCQKCVKILFPVVCFSFLLKQNVFALKLQYKEPPLPSPPSHTHIHTLQYLART